MVNPDNFIFHSDFWYPTGYLYGTKEYVNAPIPAAFEMSDQYTEDSYYSINIEYPAGGIGEKFISNTIIPFTDNNKLMVFKGAQSVGATFTGKLHWRIYPKNTSFNFNSSGILEQTAKTLDGYIEAPGNVNVIDFSVPSGLTGKYFPRGTFQIEGRSAALIGYGFMAIYDTNNNAVIGEMVTYPEILPEGTKIYYKIQLVPVEPQDTYIFNSDKYSFAIPLFSKQYITSGTTIGPNEIIRKYGEWTDIPGEKTAFDMVVEWSGQPGATYLHYNEMQFMPGSVAASSSFETNNGKIRPVLEIQNYSSNTVTYEESTVTYRIYMYQNNNTA